MIMVAVLVSAVAGLLIGGAYYAAVPSSGSGAAGQPDRPVALVVLVELARSAAIGGVLVWLTTTSGRDGVLDGVVLGLVLAVVPVVLLLGAVFHEGAPPRSAAVHGGDWLIKLTVLGGLVGSLI